MQLVLPAAALVELDYHDSVVCRVIAEQEVEGVAIRHRQTVGVEVKAGAVAAKTE